MEIKIKFSKIREVLSPSRGTERSAGIDFYIPKINNEFINDLIKCNEKFNNNINNSFIINEYNKSITIMPSKYILIPSGIKINLPPNNSMLFVNKSGIAVKKGLIVGAQLIDEDYQGEIHIHLFNLKNTYIEIYQDEKIIQGIIIPTFYYNLEEVQINDLYDKKTKRGKGGFGSTNKN